MKKWCFVSLCCSFICSNTILFVYFSSFSLILLCYLMWFVYFVRVFTSSI